MNKLNTDLPLTGLSGSSLLGFMAALGAFKTLAELAEGADLRMRWVAVGTSYLPVLSGSLASDSEVLLQRLHERLASFAGHYVVTGHKDLKIPANDFRLLAIKSVRAFLVDSDLIAPQFVSAFGCDAITDGDGFIEDTGFRTMSGAGHQHFLAFMDELARGTTIEHLRESLLGPWLYRDPSPIMRWDSEDDRRYALRWDEPSKDPVRTVRGANRLAIASLPLFPVVPISAKSIATTGFKGRSAKDTFFAWPIWAPPISLQSLRSLLSIVGEESTENGSSPLQARGVCAIYQSQRITLGKFRNFTPSSRKL